MATVSDNFNRANSASLGSQWTDLTGLAGTGCILGIDSNHCASPTGGGNNEGIAGWATSDTIIGADQYAQGVITIADATKNVAPAVRLTGSTWFNTIGYALWNQDGVLNNIRLYRFDIAMSFTQIADFGLGAVSGDTSYVQVSGSTFKAYRNGSQIGTDQTDSTIASGQPGIFQRNSANTDSYMDDFLAGDLVTTPPPAMGGRVFRPVTRPAAFRPGLAR